MQGSSTELTKPCCNPCALTLPFCHAAGKPHHALPGGSASGVAQRCHGCSIPCLLQGSRLLQHPYSASRRPITFPSAPWPCLKPAEGCTASACLACLPSTSGAPCPSPSSFTLPVLALLFTATRLASPSPPPSPATLPFSVPRPARSCCLRLPLTLPGPPIPSSAPLVSVPVLSSGIM